MMEELPSPGLYVHVPFCRRKCPYCGFYSLATRTMVSRWALALKREAMLHRDTFGTFDSLYLGGGTPSLLELGTIESLLATFHDVFTFDERAEVTIEANPGDLTPEKAKGLRQLGFNRLIVGVQSLDDRALGFLGRAHTADDARQALRHAKNAGFPVLGVDLIYGLGDPVLDASWAGTLEEVLQFAPEHLSCYQLSIEERTPFATAAKKGLLLKLDEETARALFLATSRTLEAGGYTHYEISNFARGDEHKARHNQKYWRHTPYLGLGPAAHSFQKGRRWWNPASVKGYCSALDQGRHPTEGHEQLTTDQVALERVALGLRTRDGFTLGPDLKARISAEALARVHAQRLVTFRDGRVRPTLEGFCVADRLPLELLD